MYLKWNEVKAMDCSWAICNILVKFHIYLLHNENNDLGISAFANCWHGNRYNSLKFDLYKFLKSSSTIDFGDTCKFTHVALTDILEKFT